MTRIWTELSPGECAELIAAGGVGRLAFCTPAGPQIVPLTFVVSGASIIFRTSPYSMVGTQGTESAAAFEVDDLSPSEQSGWSVVACGAAQAMSDPDEIAEIRALSDPQPWVDGSRTLYIRLSWQTITGRRIDTEVVRPADTGVSLVG